MCGIVGVIGREAASSVLMEGLRHLEYRGYDSAGIATLVDGNIYRRRAEGKLQNLQSLLEESPIIGQVGIGHTRWATHGVPNEINAHPHATEKVAIVHNGIIENYRELRVGLTDCGYTFKTDTDSEAVVQLITQYLDDGYRPVEATGKALARLEGAFALAIIFAGEHDLMIGARQGSPLVVGWGQDAMYLGSDALALASVTDRVSYLEEGDRAILSTNGAKFENSEGFTVERGIKLTALTGGLVGKGNHQHFMLKEIYEQPTVIGETLNTFFNPATRIIKLPELTFDITKISKVTIVACGTSYFAGMVARYWFERIAGVSVEIDIASEFRYRRAALPENGLGIFISQSGETADTLAALRYARDHGNYTLAVVNNDESTMAREADTLLLTRAGPEVGVAATKTFTCQLVALACFIISMARARGEITQDVEAKLSDAIAEVPARASDVLKHDGILQNLAKRLVDAQDILYMGRASSYPIALEGALKLKEISYIHAEGFAAGELKHGPIALIDKGVPVIVIAPSDDVFEKTASNMEEVIARGAMVVLLGDERGLGRVGGMAAEAIQLPEVDPVVAPILYAIPVQLLAYYIAVAKGTDVDQPRNLAKSVTVE